MSFLNAAFLWGLPLLAVPVAIHMLNRQRKDVVRWSAMQFLNDTRIRRRKNWRLDDLLLMLLRTLALLGIVLALSRPMWNWSGFGSGSGRDVIFVWDVSMSMGREVVAGRPTFDNLLDQTKDLMDQLRTSDTIRGMVTIGRGEWLEAEAAPASFEQKHQLLDGLRRVGVTQSSADWMSCLGSALRVASSPQSKARLVVVLSDGQAYGWRQQDELAWKNLARLAEESRIPTAIEFHNVMSSTVDIHNVSVDKLSTPRQLLAVGESMLIEAEIGNHGQDPVQQVIVNWSIDDIDVGNTSVGPLEPGQTRQLTLNQLSTRPGIRRLKCRVDFHDQLQSDNERTLILETIEYVSLLLVDDSTESDPLKTDKGYFLAALGQSPDGRHTSGGKSVFRVTTITPQELSEQSLSDFRAVVFANTPNLDEVACLKLTDFVRNGGGLWLALGDRTHAIEFNRSFFRAGGGLSPWSVTEANENEVQRQTFETIHPPDREHPATMLLNDTQRLDIDRVKVYRRFPFVVSPARTNVPVLLESGSGNALAVEGNFGRGRVIVQSFPMGVRWSSLPLTQSYVPMLHEWLWYLIQPTAISRNLVPGEPLQIAIPKNEPVREVTVTRPGGNALSVTSYHLGDQAITQTRQTQLPGEYKAILKIDGKNDEVQPYQVTRSLEESNLEQWSPELRSKWNRNPALRLNPVTPLKMPSSLGVKSLGEPIWTTLLVMSVLALFCELWLVRRMATKRFAFHTDSPTRKAIASQTFSSLKDTRGNL